MVPYKQKYTFQRKPYKVTIPLMPVVVLQFGSNTGNRLQLIDIAVKQCVDRIGPCEKISDYYQSPPWGFSSNHDFINCVASFSAMHRPEEILAIIQRIEKEMGRERHGKGYTDRLIDIDILFYDQLVLKTPDLTIPHPLMAKRRFVLLPLSQIYPGWLHPGLQITVSSMLQACDDDAEVVVYRKA